MDSNLPRSAALIVNAHSRKGQAAFREARRLIAARGIELVASEALHDPATLPERVKAAVERGAPMVIVGGGDGSISCAVDALVGTDTILALLPLGTANSFARTLGIPLDLGGAAEVIAKGQARAIDLGMVDGDYFANVAAIGVAPLIAGTIPRWLKKWFGRPGYMAWAAVQMARFRPFRLTVGDETLDALEVRIANGRFQGGTELARTEVDDGRILVQAVVGSWRTKLLWSWGLTLLGPEKARGTVREYRGREFRVSTDPTLPISIDGEVLAHTPVSVRAAPRAIRVAVPS